MKWEDTIMNPLQIKMEFEGWADLVGVNQENGAWQVASAQAEISYKAGQDTELEYMDKNLVLLLKMAENRARKEVVRCLKEHPDFYNKMLECSTGWQAKLKEWRL